MILKLLVLITLFASEVFAADSTTVVPITCPTGFAITAITSRGVAICTAVSGSTSPPILVGVSPSPNLAVYDPTTTPESFWLTLNGGKAPSYTIPGTGVYYVSPSGDDSANGAVGTPFLTLAHAIVAANNNPGSTIILRAGEYRYTWMEIQTPTTIQNYPAEVAKVLGTDKTTASWTVSGGTWWTAWTRWDQGRFPDCSSSIIDTTLGPLASPRQVFYVNTSTGMWTRLTPVGSIGAVATGKFFFDSAAQRIYIGDDPGAANREVEITYEPIAFNVSADNVMVRGIVFKGHGSTCGSDPGQAVMSVNNKGFTADNNVFAYNAFRGIKLFGQNGVNYNQRIKNNVFLHNGGGGVGGYRSTAAIIEKNYFGYNNVQHFIHDGVFGDAGNKFASTHNLVVWANTFDHEFANAMWCDTDCPDFVFTRNIARYSTGSGTAGVFYEASGAAGSAIIAGNLIYNNDGSGIALSGSGGNVRMYNNSTIANGVGGFAESEDYTGQTWNNNLVSDTNGAQVGTQYDVLYYTFNGASTIVASDYNIYHRTSSANPATLFNWAFANYSTLAAFKAAIATHEQHSIAVDNAAASTVYNLNKTTNVYTAAGVALNAGTALPADIAAILGVATSPVNIGYLP